MTQLCGELQREREVHEARLTGEHVTGLRRIAGDQDRRATIARDRALLHVRHRGVEHHRCHRERNTVKTVSTCGRVEAVVQLLHRRCIDLRVDEKCRTCVGIVGRLQ